MKLCFDSIEEIKEFMTRIKGTRGGKNKDETEETETVSAPATVATSAVTTAPNTAPAPMQPPAGDAPNGSPSFPAAGFPGGGVTLGAPTAAPSGPSPEVAALVTRINNHLGTLAQNNQLGDQALSWLRNQCGPEAASATIDQIKGIFLAKLQPPALDQIAKLIGAPAAA